jgi:hypothetical protein
LVCNGQLILFPRFFDSNAPLEIIDTLAKSPVLNHFTFAPSVLALVNRMLPAISPKSPPYAVSEYFKSPAKPRRDLHWKHILALHLRRGDGWAEACTQKAINAE